MVSVTDFGAVGDGIADDSAAFTAAIAEVERRQRGGVIEVPAGIFRARIDASKLTADFEKRVTIRGAGRGATQIKPTASGDIILNMVGRNVMTVEDLTIYAGEQYQAYAGIVLARTDSSPNCNNNKFMNVEVIGNFGKAGVVSIAAESGEWHNCRFFMSSGGSGVAVIIGSDPHAANVSLAVPGFTDLRKDADTDTRWIACEFQSYEAAEPVRLSAFHSHHFIGTTWIAPNATRLVRFCDPDGGAMGSGTTFTDCHFEGLTPTGSVFWVDMANATAYLFGITERASTIVTTQGSAFLDYDRTDPRNLLVLQQSAFAPAGPPNTTQTGIHFYADLIDRSVIDYTRIGDRGTLFCFLQAQYSRLAGRTIRCPQAIQADIQYPEGNDTPPATGTFPRGARIENAGAANITTPMAIGDVAAWKTIAGGSVDGDPGGMAIATTTGSGHATLGGGYPVYEGAKVHIGNYGPAVIRLLSGQDVYLSAAMTATAPAASLNFSGAVYGRFAVDGHLS